MDCTKWLWHSWGRWETEHTVPRKSDDGLYYRRLVQSRKCKRCNYIEEVWLNSAEVCPIEEEGDD